MPAARFIHPDGTEDLVEVPPGVSIMQAATGAGIDGIVAECGGCLMCATCHVYVEPGFASALPDLGPDEDEMLECTAAPRTPESRLSCQLVMTAGLDGISVRVPDEQI